MAEDSKKPSVAHEHTSLHEARRRGYVAAYCILRSADDAKDAVQEATLEALASHARYDPSRPYYAWFYGILKNVCRGRLRRRKNELARTDDASVETIASGSGGAEAAAIDRERQRALTEAIGRMPEDLRELIELRHFQDASYEEMAAALEIPIGTVMSRLYRARKQLREKLLESGAFFDEKGGREP